MKIFAFGSSIVSSYWNGAATYYRGCYKYLSQLGHSITFAEPDAYGRQQHHDKEDLSFITSVVYKPGVEVSAMLECAADADVVIKHSGIGVDDGTLEHRLLELQKRSIVIFWDVDAPATLARIENGLEEALRTSLARYDAVITYGGGPACRDRYMNLGARLYFSIYNGLDPETHFPVQPDPSLASDLTFLGNRLPDREARVEELFLTAAQLVPKLRFLLGGEGWAGKRLPDNVRYVGHVSTSVHNQMNCSAGMVININRESMAKIGFSPPTRIFEVAGAGACLLCDDWPGLDECFQAPSEVLIVKCAKDVAAALTDNDKLSRKEKGQALRTRALRDHTYERRARQLEEALLCCLARRMSDRAPE